MSFLEKVRNLATVGLVCFIILGSVVIWKSHTVPMNSAQASAPSIVINDEFDQFYNTSTSVSRKGDSIRINSCMKTNLRLQVIKDSVVISNGITGVPIIVGNAVNLEDGSSTLVCMSTNLTVNVPFTLTRYRPKALNPEDPKTLFIIFHIGNPDDPFFFLSKLNDCDSIKQVIVQ